MWFYVCMYMYIHKKIATDIYIYIYIYIRWMEPMYVYIMLAIQGLSVAKLIHGYDTYILLSLHQFKLKNFLLMVEMKGGGERRFPPGGGEER